MRAAKTIAPTRGNALLLVFAPFVVLAALFLVTDLLAMRRVAQLREAAELIEEDMLADMDLLGQMRGDLDRLKLLADQHVLEKDGAAMARIEDEIRGAEAGFAAASDTFGSMPMLPPERAPWQELTAAIAAIKPRLETVLDPSRVNDDERAFAALRASQADFDRADRSLQALVTVNRQAAKEGEARVADLQGSATAGLQVLAVAGVGLSVLLGGAVIRTLHGRNQKLQAVNRELDAFAGRVAHDLRAPLTTATLATVRLSKQSPTPDQVKSVESLQRAFHRMTQLIEDLLAISRAQSTEPRCVCDPARAAEELREELGPRASSDDVELLIQVEPAQVRCSEGLFRQVMWNLADNAMKYRRADAHACVEICGHAAGDRYELSVRDNGVGIDSDEVGKVFEAFYRAAGGRGQPGTGLGLSIVKRAVEANGGTVTVTSKVGSGSMFVARLPLAGPAAGG